MGRKIKATIPVLVLFMIGSVSATQPKITEVTDNLGNTFTLDVRDDGDSNTQFRDELVVKDDMSITLCISEVEAESTDDLEYTFKLDSVRKDNVRDWTSDNCNTWNLNKTDYKNEWEFWIRVKNDDDDILYNGNEDYIALVEYQNLVLEGETDNSENLEYDSIQISKSKLEDLRASNEEKSSRIQELENKVNQQEENISQLEDQVSSLQETIEKKTSSIESLQETIEERDETISELEAKNEDLESNLTQLENENQELRNSGIIDSITGFFFKSGQPSNR